MHATPMKSCAVQRGWKSLMLGVDPLRKLSMEYHEGVTTSHTVVKRVLQS